MLTRRNTLQAAAASWLLTSLPRPARAEAPTAKAPRYFVTLFLRGGIDGVLTLDPKTRADVDADIDVPYQPGSIVDAGNTQLGPQFDDLKPFADRMAIVRGLQVHIANHESGAFQMLRFRTGVTATAPSMYEIIGQRRETPLAAVTLGDLSSFDYTAASLVAPTGNGGTTSLEALDNLDDDDLALLAKTYQKHLKGFSATGLSESHRQTRENLAQVSAYLDRCTKTPRFKVDPWHISRDTEADLQRTLWMLENDMTRGVTVKIQFDWDSHFRNADKQAPANRRFQQLLARFLKELESRKNEHGTLASQTVLIVGSELGRFPVLNGNLGKDHFPETSLMLFGPGIKAGAYGQTGKRMESIPVSTTTGRPQDVGGRRLEFDDIGVTLMHLAGLNPAVYGYRGERLRFLEA